MSDNPFAEPEDPDRTVIRPAPGGRRIAPPPQPPPAFRDAPPPPAAADTGESISFGLNPLIAAAAPLLQLLGRLRNTYTRPDPSDLRERVVQQIHAFEQAARDGGVPMDQLRPAHYALCASLDDVVLNTPWGGAGDWDERSLVATFHQEVRGGERFFDLLGQHRQNPGTFLPVLELMYLCLSLGFQGRHRLSPRGPGELERLREDLYAVIVRHVPPVDPALAPRWQGVQAPYRAARAVVPTWLLGAGALAVIGGLFIWFSTGLNAASDVVFAQLLAAPIPHMPQIPRAAAVRPPPPATLPPEPLAVFLRPEIDQGLVTVFGDHATAIVRIRNRGMFPFGSATVAASYVHLLDRIGEALRTENGPVTVDGYTDNQPIHTVQFPSNFQLSAMRAEAARSIIARALGDPGRVAAQGHADADPVAPNASPDGRDQNRRIEVVLRRQG